VFQRAAVLKETKMLIGRRADAACVAATLPLAALFGHIASDLFEAASTRSDSEVKPTWRLVRFAVQSRPRIHARRGPRRAKIGPHSTQYRKAKPDFEAVPQPHGSTPRRSLHSNSGFLDQLAPAIEFILHKAGECFRCAAERIRTQVYQELTHFRRSEGGARACA